MYSNNYNANQNERLGRINREKKYINVFPNFWRVLTRASNIQNVYLPFGYYSYWSVLEKVTKSIEHEQ